ncbi:MAG TPA: pilus assembly PilX N-terminal domain-containing protein, partial [candidate division Zixibacteria bacterium]|nr:pilus assembly PilX N-terminal domain-containing protein [candidate division Zixibacteria bacterium]
MSSLLQKNRGSAFLITICLIGLLTLVAITAVDFSNTDVEVSFNQQHEEKAFYAAESGIARAMSVLKTNSDWRTGFAGQSVGNEKYSVVVLDSLTQPSLKDTLLIRSTGNSETSRSIIEVLLVAAKFHPLYEHAIYAGNREEYDSSLAPDSQNYTYDIEFGGTGSTSDSITGNVWMNGHAEVNGGAVIDGSADVGGDFTGNTPTGGANTSVDYLKPPDLKAMNYETTSDFKVNGSSPWDGSGRIASTDPRHIFVKNFRSDLQPNKSFVFNNT